MYRQWPDISLMWMVSVDGLPGIWTVASISRIWKKLSLQTEINRENRIDLLIAQSLLIIIQSNYRTTFENNDFLKVVAF